jgi:Tol biopolymer transport system component
LVTNTAPGVWHLYVRDLQGATTTLVDVGANGTAAGVTSATVPALSADGRFIAFEGPDGNLVPNDNNHRLDVFVRDMVAGTNELISARHSTLVSTTPNSLSALTESSASADGRFIAYASDADNLVAGDTNGYRDVFVRDMATGNSILVSGDVAGVSGNGASFEPAISADGRYIAFTSSATNLVADDTNKLADIFVRDLQATTTVLSSRSPDGRPSDGACSSPLLSKDGRWLLFRSQAHYLTGGFISFTGNLFLRDTQSATNWALTTMGVDALAMTPDGRFATYLSRLGYAPGTVYSFVWDSSLAVPVLTNATPASYGFGVAISPDGKRMASVTATQLVFMDREANTTWSVTAASPSTWTTPAFSADGKWLAYARQLSAMNQVFLRDLDSGAESLVSHVWNSVEPGAGGSDSPAISPSGRFVAYRTWATNLVVGAVSAFRQIMLYDRPTGLNTLVSANRISGGPADDHSLRARFSADGQTLLIRSWASDLLANDSNASGDVFATAIFTLVILPPATPGHRPVLSWPLVPGGNPRVQFKDDLADPIWRDCSGSITNDGWKAWLQDNPATNAQRFYRVIAP